MRTDCVLQRRKGPATHERRQLAPRNIVGLCFCHGLVAGLFLVLAPAEIAFAQDGPKPSDAPQSADPKNLDDASKPGEGSAPQAETTTTVTKEPTVAEKPKPANYYVRSKGWGARNESDPPAYVKPMNKRKYLKLDDVDWLEFGIEHRTRWEYRDDDLRKPNLQKDDEFLMRTRLYFGVKEILDPFRFAVELQDSREEGSDFPQDNRDVDEFDVLQAYGELYFQDALGAGRPLRFQFGRIAFDYIDRKLIARNRWRNTTNNFDGFRVQFGQQSNDCQLDLLAVQPVIRDERNFDHSDEERWVYAVIGAWRRWSKYVTFEPYYIVSEEDRADATPDREIHTIGMHTYGPIAGTKFDYDTNLAYQCGRDGANNQRAFAGYGELGYTFEHEWKPRLSVSGMYATGDRDPNDTKSERFDRLFGAGHFISTFDYFTWRNVISPRLRLEFQPHKKLRLDTSYGAFWLASDSDGWTETTRRDRTGNSGDFVGQEIDLRARYQVADGVELEVGYAYFIQGSFVDNTGPSDDGDFFYVQTAVAIP